MKSIRASLTVIDDPLLSDYIRTIGHRLASNSDAAGQHFDFFMVDSAEINAFAGPNGHIGINTGLILSTQSEGELASVLAHEIAHVSQNHLMRAFDTASQMGIPTAAMILASIILGATVSSAAGVAAIASTQAGLIQQQINFTRSNELEADHIGMQTLAHSDFDPRAMPAFFGRLTQATRIYESGAPTLLRTHPVSTDRIADALGRADNYPYKQYTDSLQYHFVRAKLRNNSFRLPSEAVDYFDATLKDGRYRHRDAEEYGYLLALTADQQFDKAEQTFEQLLKKHPNEPAVIIAGADLHRHNNRPEQALELLEAGLKQQPGNFPLSIAYATTLLSQKQPQHASEVLREVVNLRPSDPLLRKLYSEAAKSAQQRLIAREQLAEHHYLLDELEPAILQLRLALKELESSDDYQSERIRARLKALQHELLQNKRQQRQ